MLDSDRWGCGPCGATGVGYAAWLDHAKASPTCRAPRHVDHVHVDYRQRGWEFECLGCGVPVAASEAAEHECLINRLPAPVQAAVSAVGLIMWAIQPGRVGQIERLGNEIRASIAAAKRVQSRDEGGHA